jgi:hypothetical protein
MTPGTDYSVSVTMRNTGSTTWTEAAQYRLSSRGPRDNTTWGINRVHLAPGDSVTPGEQVTFAFDVTAPSTPGSYSFSWSMVQDGVDWFNDVSPAINVTVAGATTAPTTLANASSDKAWGKCGGSIPVGSSTPLASLLAAAAALLLAAVRRRGSSC